MQIYDVTDARFKKYGRIIKNIDFSTLVSGLKEIEIPEGVAYEPAVESLEKLPIKEEIERVFYGELPIQIGYCNGHNTKLNALEYHRSSEINVCATDAILMLGLESDIEEDLTYDTGKIEVFRVPAGTAVEVFATTLHYAPCQTSESGFQVGIVLPKGTNYPLDGTHEKGEDALITSKNKWLIGHSEGGLPKGSFIGLKGENLSL